MRNLLFAAAAFALTSACLSISTVTPLPSLTSPTNTAPANGSAAGNATATPPTAPASTQPSNTGAVSLQVLSPQDGSVVNTSQVLVMGAASPGAVVTVNDDILLVGADGHFQSNVSLDEGPNLIEIIASNSSGNETTLDLTVTYEP